MGGTAPARRIGLTGGMGCGKSTVAALLAAPGGAAIIDSDAIARALTGPGGEAIEAIGAAFGAQILDASGALDRVRMRTLVLADAQQRRRLEAILHPRIRDHSRAQARALEFEVAFLVFDVPLLAETPALREELGLERVLVVDCPAAVQRARALARGTMTAAQVDAMLAVQAERRKRLDLADDILVNAGSIDELRARVARLERAYRARAL